MVVPKNPYFYETHQHIRRVGPKIRSDHAVLYEGKFGKLGAFEAVRKRTDTVIRDFGLHLHLPAEIITDVLGFIDAPTFSEKAPKPYADLGVCMLNMRKDGLIDDKENHGLWGLASTYFVNQSKVIAVVRGTKVEPKSILREIELLHLLRRKLPPELRERVLDILCDPTVPDRDAAAIAPNFVKQVDATQKVAKQMNLRLDVKSLLAPGGRRKRKPAKQDTKQIIARYKKILKELKTLRIQLDRDFDKLKKQTARDLAKCKHAQDKADLLGTLATMAGGLLNLAKATYKSTQVTGAELAKLNRKILVDVGKDKTNQTAQLLGDMVSDDVGSDGNAVLFAKATLKAWSDMNKLSFWGAAYSDMVESRKFKWDPVSWSKYSEKIRRDSDAKVDGIRKKMKSDLDARIRKYETLIASLEKVK
ncbi:hypothetical protein E0K89_000995 [Aquicoccus sp. SCR17]|nr:hypothetical protein [Carideicomes alvinocaridis]